MASGPHLSAAFLCEKILTEKDNVPSFIRIIERFTIPTFPRLPEEVQFPSGFQPLIPAIQANLVVMLKAGGLSTGKYSIRIALIKPDATEFPSNTVEVFFNGGDDNGVLVISPINLPNPDEGLYWFDVYFLESLITRVPMRVLYQQMQPQLR